MVVCNNCVQRFEAWITYKPTRAVDGADDGERSCGGYVLVLKGLSQLVDRKRQKRNGKDEHTLPLKKRKSV